MARAKSARGRAWRSVVASYGGDFKAAARKWRSMRKPRYAANAWKDDPVGHAQAAAKGWRKRGKRRVKFHPKRWGKQTRKAHVRGRLYRRLRRYARRGVVRVAANPRRRRGRRRYYRNPSIAANPRRRSHRRSYRRYARSYRRNPARKLLGSIKDVFSMDTLKDGGAAAGGVLAAIAVPNLLLNVTPLKNVRALDFLRAGVGSYVASLVATGLASWAAAYFGQRRLARGLLIGGVAGTLSRLTYDVLVPRAPAAVQAALVAPAGMKGLGLSASIEDEVERQVELELARQGISDYLTPGQAASASLSDYLTPGQLATVGVAGGGDAVFGTEF